MYTMSKEFLEKLYIKPRVRPTKVTEEVVEEPIKKAEEVVEETVNNTEDTGVMSQLIKPISFAVDEFGRVVEPENTDEETTDQKVEITAAQIKPEEEEEQVNVDFSNMVEDNEEPVVDESNPYLTEKNRQASQIKEAMKNPTQTLADNSIIISKYPQLKLIERAIRDAGLDCSFVQRPDKIIATGVLANGIFMPTASFMIDLDGVIIGKEHKWFNTFIDQNIAPEVLENFFAISISNLEVIKKYVTGTGTIDDLKNAALYSREYIAVNDIVDLESFPETINPDVKNKIVERLYKAISSGVFNECRRADMDVFKVDKYVSPISYVLKSGNIFIKVGKERITVEQSVM